MEEEKVVEEQKVEEKQTETQAEQIVELPAFQTFKQKMEEGGKTVEEILYGDGEYFSL